MMGMKSVLDFGLSPVFLQDATVKQKALISNIDNLMIQFFLD